MQWRIEGDSIKVLTPAKINLFLEVLGKRPDGFHELQTLITGIDLFDQLVISRTDKSGIELRCKWNPETLAASKNFPSIWGDLPQGSSNLVYSAANLFLERCEIRAGLEIDLVKSIPSQAGLGGASSNAAGTLIALNEFFQAGCDDTTLLEWSAELGSDLPFFVFSKLAICEGRGERVRLCEQAPDIYFVVVKPDFGLSTPEIFSRVSIPESPQPLDLSGLIETQIDWQKVVFNRLQEPAIEVAPQIAVICDRLLALGCTAAQMTGSGSCCYGMCESPQEAQAIADELTNDVSGFVFTCRNLQDFPVRE